VAEVTTIAAVHGVLGPYSYPQHELTESFARLCLPGDERKAAVARRLHASTTVATRHLALPLERYAELGGFTEANEAFLSVAVELGAQAVAGAIKEAGLAVDDIDLIMSTTVTGIAVPSLDALIANRLRLRPDVRRMPLMGLGCVAGAAGLARVHDFLRGAPDAVAVLVSVELCSLTLQRGDVSVANIVASGLFGDGAAAVVLTGAQRELPGPTIVDSRSHLYPDTERAMGWDVGSAGLRIVLGAEVPDLVREYLAGDVAGLLDAHGLTVADIDPWICHTGGPKVIEAIEDVLDLPSDALALTWRSLREVGNLSSASVLHVLRDTLATKPVTGDGWGVLLAMGPGFCAELVLIRW
jgi:alkylresorcinol/alkylpyrone synthase